MVRECIALGTLARKSAYRGYLGDRLLRRKFIFRGTGGQLFECERQLIDQPRRTFRSLPIDLTLQPGDPQFLLGNQGIFGSLGASAIPRRANTNASFRAATSSGTASGEASMTTIES